MSSSQNRENQKTLRRGRSGGLALPRPRAQGGGLLRKLRALIKAPDFAISKNFLTPRRKDAVKRLEGELPPAATSQRPHDARTS